MGVQSIKDYLTDDNNFGVAASSIFPQRYSGSSGTGIPTQNAPNGLAVVQVRLLVSLVC